MTPPLLVVSKEADMPYIRVWLHCVWGTKRRRPFITNENKYKILIHILTNAKDKGVHIDTINAYRNHVHALISLTSDQSVAKIIQLMKGESSHWINKHHITKHKFEWADEYYAGSVSDYQVHNVRKYILRQDIHHNRNSDLRMLDELIENALLH